MEYIFPVCVRGGDDGVDGEVEEEDVSEANILDREISQVRMSQNFEGPVQWGPEILVKVQLGNT